MSLPLHLHCPLGKAIRQVSHYYDVIFKCHKGDSSHWRHCNFSAASAQTGAPSKNYAFLFVRQDTALFSRAARASALHCPC